MKHTKYLLLLFVTIVLSAVTAQAVEEITDSVVVGHWVFMHKGQKRNYEFRSDHTFAGHYPVSGKHFVGTWTIDRSMIVLVRGGEVKDFGRVTLQSDGEGDYLAEGRRMIGQKE